MNNVIVMKECHGERYLVNYDSSFNFGQFAILRLDVREQVAARHQLLENIAAT